MAPAWSATPMASEAAWRRTARSSVDRYGVSAIHATSAVPQGDPPAGRRASPTPASPRYVQGAEGGSSCGTRSSFLLRQPRPRSCSPADEQPHDPGDHVDALICHPPGPRPVPLARIVGTHAYVSFTWGPAVLAQSSICAAVSSIGLKAPVRRPTPLGLSGNPSGTAQTHRLVECRHWARDWPRRHGFGRPLEARFRRP